MKHRGRGFSRKRFPRRSPKDIHRPRYLDKPASLKQAGRTPNTVLSASTFRAFSAAHQNDRLRDYKEYFTLARTLGRKLKFLAGPTNSGKTFRALNDLAVTSAGLYLAPLRLLALEGQEELEKRGVVASFITGEERDLRDGARFVASTIEMANLQDPVECAVIDEIQLLADPTRGWAWAQALIGVPASRVIMTGSADAIPLVQAMADYLGEPLEIELFDRYTPLELLNTPTALESVEAGTAIIAFSRRDVLNIKQFLQKEIRMRVSVIYGNLSPQVRREEARRFRSGESDVVVATDAIGMGLNLPIRQVLFFVTQKFNGEQMVPLSESEIRQIAGRAGRFGIHDEGFTGALDSWEDHRLIGAALRNSPRSLEGPVGIMPSPTYLEALARALNTRKLEVVLKEFQKNMVFDSHLLVPGVTDDMIQLATWTDQFSLELDTRYLLACAPVDPGEGQVMDYWLSYLRAIAGDTPARAVVPESVFQLDPTDSNNLLQAEMLVKCMTLYAWLAYRDEVLFPEINHCNKLRNRLNSFIEAGLKQKGLKMRCKYCRRVLPVFHEYGICERCFRSRRHRQN